MEIMDMTHGEDMIDLCVQIIDAEIQEREEIKILSPFGTQVWKITDFINETTIGNYEAHITFETPNGVLKVHIHVNKHEPQNFMGYD